MNKRVLVVDDSIFIYKEMEHMLQDTEFDIAAYAKSGEEAIQLYGKVLPDIVTLDIILPGIDGLDTAKQILEKYPEAKIIIVSSLAYDETMTEAKQIGAFDFIFKPIEQVRLVKALAQAFV